MKNILFIFLFALLCITCKEEKSKFIKLSVDEMIQYAVERKALEPSEVLFRNQFGNEISFDSAGALYQTDKYFNDLYVDENGLVQEVVLRPKTEADKKTLAQINEALNAGPKLENIEVDCTNLSPLLEEIHASDQGMRTGESDIDPTIDHQNLEKVVSILENCDRNMLTFGHLNTIWLVVQHGAMQYQKKYIPFFKDCAAQGKLRQTSVAMMEDRILMREGEPQIYGTQVVKDMETGKWKVYEIADPESLNERRAAIGFETIEDYLKSFDFEVGF